MRKPMKFKQFLENKDVERFDVVEIKEGENLIGYSVKYSFSGTTLSEELNVKGLSKRTTKKRLEDCKKGLKSKLHLGESTALVGTPGTDIIRNDFGSLVFPHGFPADATLTTPQEREAAVLFIQLVSPDRISSYINQASDAMATAEKLGQTNRVEDLKIRIDLAKLGLGLSDKLGKFQAQ